MNPLNTLNPLNPFKVVLIGDGGVGKSALVRRCEEGQFDPRYIATLGVNVTPLRFNTNHGAMCINLWDCAGQERFGGLRDGYYVGAQGAIVAFDLTSRLTMKNTGRWIQDAWRMNQNMPFVVCGMKSDIPNHQVTSQEFQEEFSKSGMSLFEVSSKSNYNADKPFCDILRQMSGHDDLTFVDEKNTTTNIARARL